ncbi:surface protease GP63 [Trypanosoma cruzi Dm28c]|uniref:Leishmanolysin-like peptidase n=1 Tax=Trypanosoma cruzi Dm28c TaxID=1416333 RepID=V5B556_TRYCR|nr:surface protease GP63 [Trypanosoma cruzi Dm28c]
MAGNFFCRVMMDEGPLSRVAGVVGARSVCVLWAATCNTMSDIRPYIGAMNFDPKYMTDTAWSVRVAAHEIAHALGFGQENMEEKSILKNSVNIVRGKGRKMVAGKHVQEKAKAHFGCKTLSRAWCWRTKAALGKRRFLTGRDATRGTS